MSSQPTNAGIITDAAGVRHIPESTRADGSTRRAIKIRPGYQPPEDVALYKARMAENFRSKYKNGVPGAEVKEESKPAAAASTTPVARGVPGAAPAAPASASAETTDTSNKNAKRREARKKAAAAAAETAKSEKSEKATETKTASTASTSTTAPPLSAAAPAAAPVDDSADREKKARGLKKKLKQAKELKNKRDDGEALLPEQIAKVIRINELVRELDALGFDAEGESKT